MKKLITGLLSCFAVGLLIAPIAQAQTPDGQTPAEEGICDELNTPGVTKGLYGLCVAFCEAQDTELTFSDPITEEELEALENSAPSGKILTNYNKRRDKAGQPEIDPPMPCIMIEESCPCWTAENLASVDGLIPPNNDPASQFKCLRLPGFIRINERSPLNHAVALSPNSEDGGRCTYSNDQTSPPAGLTLSVLEGTLTNQQAETCAAEVEAACLAAFP